MYSLIIDGKTIAAGFEETFKTEIEQLKQETHRTPCLVVLMVGDNPASYVYVNQKKKACERVGIKCLIETYPSDIDQHQLITRIHDLNHDSNVHGILIQLPLPWPLDEGFITQQVSVHKDVDGFSTFHMGSLMIDQPKFVPCTAQAVCELLKTIPVDYTGKYAVIVGRSNIVGKPLIPLLLGMNMTVTTCHSKSEHLETFTRQADVVIMAVGVPNLLKADMVKDKAIVIDVGINRVDGKLTGDVDFTEVGEVASYITPVPGGVGPMTIAMLMKNVLQAYKTSL